MVFSRSLRTCEKNRIYGEGGESVKDLDQINLEYWGEDYAPKDKACRCTVLSARLSGIAEIDKTALLRWVVDASIGSTLDLDDIHFRRIN